MDFEWCARAPWILSDGNPWVALKNDVFLVVDIIAGLVVVVAAVSGRRLTAQRRAGVEARR